MGMLCLRRKCGGRDKRGRDELEEGRGEGGASGQRVSGCLEQVVQWSGRLLAGRVHRMEIRRSGSGDCT